MYGGIYYGQSYYGGLPTTTGNYTVDLSDTLVLSETITKAIARALSDTLSTSEVLSAIKIQLKTLSDSVSLVETMLMAKAKFFVEVLELAETFTKQRSKVLSDSVTVAFYSLTKALSKNPTDVLVIVEGVRTYLNGVLTVWTKIAKQAGGIWTNIVKTVGGAWTKSDKTSGGIWTKEQKPPTL